MGLGFKRSHTPCWCSAGCYPDTWPFDRYFIRVTGIGTPYPNWKLFAWNGNPPNSFECIWEAVSPLYGPGQEILTKRPVTTQGSECGAWEWKVLIVTPTTPHSFTERRAWGPNVGAPPTTEDTESCSQTQFSMIADVPVPPLFVEVQAALPDACDDSDHPAKIQRTVAWPGQLLPVVKC